MIITGLDNNNYLINNNINVIINDFGTSIIKYLEVKATNTYNSKFNTLRFYPINNTFKFDISSLVKSTFDYPNNDVLKTNNLINLEFKTVDVADVFFTTTISKYFIRGGNFNGAYPISNEIKQNYLGQGNQVQVLISYPMPYWGTKYDIYKINNGFELIDNSSIDDSAFENIEIPCNGIYVKFLNQYGTYSYWFFDSFEKNAKTKDLDLINNFSTNFNNNNFTDLGVTAENSITLKTKVPERFNNILLHLILSSEVYFLDNETYRRIKQKSQKHEFNPIDKMFEYKFEFELNNVLNPSLLC